MRPRSKAGPSALRQLGVPLGLEPMEAQLVAELPEGDGWQFEPKWDGFRCLAFRAGADVEIKSKSGKSLSRFFPEVVANLRALVRPAFVLDGELIITMNGVASFEALQMRLHPAASRVERLSQESPGELVAFDCLLVEAGRPLLHEPMADRRRALEGFFREEGDRHGIRITPVTRDRRLARAWLDKRQPAFDGIVAKRIDLPYRPGERAMLKIKRIRTADCVVGGFRYESNAPLVGSLLLGLYDRKGLLHHVGFTSAIGGREKLALTRQLEKLIEPPGFTGSAPGAPSRWSSARSTQWQPLRPELVVEVRYDRLAGRRFRHGTKLVRWRPDKAPRQCTFAQLSS
ncbi:MAG TPA: ATP-dependent DNA ligase [Hyphomicrobiaceae bacterium]|nr:ATP-dependent DNA ligase [Hyphomicrobiaceae bacterium]